jgi:hypothetical protein
MASCGVLAERSGAIGRTGKSAKEAAGGPVPPFTFSSLMGQSIFRRDIQAGRSQTHRCEINIDAAVQLHVV